MFPQSFQYAHNAAPAVTTASRAPLLFEAPAVGHHIHHQSEHEDWRAGAAGAAAAQATVLRQAQFGTAANLRMASNDTVASWRLPNVVRTRRDMNQQRHRSSSNTYDGAHFPFVHTCHCRVRTRHHTRPTYTSDCNHTLRIRNARAVAATLARNTACY